MKAQDRKIKNYKGANMNISYSLKHYIALAVCEHVRLICEPLWKYCNIAYFSYVRIYPDNTYMRLCSHGEWADYCIQKNHCTVAINRALKRPGNGFLMWSTKNQSGMDDTAGYFDGDHGFSLIDTYKEYTEIFTFAAPGANKEIAYFYLNNTDVLKRFTFYFKERAHNLILLASQKSNRLKLASETRVSDNFHEVLHTKNERDFLKNIHIKKYHFYIDDHEVVLSAIEVGCLHYLLKGFSVKDIALLRAVSKRTIETHVEHVKQKLHCATKYILLKKLLNQHVDKKLWDLIED